MAAGQYKGKTTNLSAKELKTAVSSAGGKKVGMYKKNLGAATKVDIGNTSFVKGKGLVNSSSPNTRITGTVTLGTGEKATYVNGRRLRASDSKPVGSGSGNGGGGKTPVKPSVNAAAYAKNQALPGAWKSADARAKQIAADRAAATPNKGRVGSKAADRAIANTLTGSATFGQDKVKYVDRLGAKKPGDAPKPSTRPKTPMPSDSDVKKATGGVYGMSAAGTPFRKAMPKGRLTDIMKTGSGFVLMPGAGLAAGAIKGGTTAGRLIASKVAGSAAGKAAGRSAVTAGAKAAGKVAGTKTAGKVAGSAAGKAVGKRVAANKAAAVKVSNRQFIDNSNAASRAASRADSIARTKAALNRASSATNKRTRASALAAARREKPKYGKGR